MSVKSGFNRIPVYVAVRSGTVASDCDLYHHSPGRFVQHAGHVLALPFVRENRTDISYTKNQNGTILV